VADLIGFELVARPFAARGTVPVQLPIFHHRAGSPHRNAVFFVEIGVISFIVTPSLVIGGSFRPKGFL